jgi:hypothetical protein
MPRPSTNRRTIVVDGCTFLYRLHHHLLVEPGKPRWVTRLTMYGQPGGTSRLVADLTPQEYELWMLLGKSSQFAPRHVAAVARHALALGWDPNSRAPDFYLRDSEAILHTAEFRHPRTTKAPAAVPPGPRGESKSAPPPHP